MYQLDPTIGASLAHPEVRGELQEHVLPERFNPFKLPVPDSDRDMLAMRLESAAETMRRHLGVIDQAKAQIKAGGHKDLWYKDPVTGSKTHLKDLRYRLRLAVEEVFWLRVVLQLNDEWRAAGIEAPPRGVSYDDEAEIKRLAGPLHVTGIEPDPRLVKAEGAPATYAADSTSPDGEVQAARAVDEGLKKKNPRPKPWVFPKPKKP